MTQRDDFDPRVAGWLVDLAGERGSPDLVDRVLDVTSRRQPRPPWLGRLGGNHLSTSTRPGVFRLRKEPSMDTRAPVLAAIAGIAVIAVVGFAILAPGTQPAPGVAGAGGAAPTATPSVAPSATPAPSPPVPTPAPTGPTNIAEACPGAFCPLDPGSYYREVEGLSVRVNYTVAADGWVSWVGAGKPTDEGGVGLSIVNVTNVVADGCTDHGAKDPPVGPTVDDLATALARLEPFEATVRPKDVEAYGYRGKYLELTLKDLATQLVGGNNWFSDCVSGEVHSWMSAPVTSYWGYYGPGDVERYWILDVDGQRLVISAGRTPNAPAGDVAELQAMLDSITIETR